MGYIIILLSPILGLIFSGIYVFLTSLGMIIVLNDKEKTK